MVKIKVDVRELKALEKNMLGIENRIKSDVERVQLSLAEKAVHTAKTVLKPDIKYGKVGGMNYRTGLLNRSYKITKESSGNKIAYYIHNEVPYFDEVETGEGHSREQVRGFFHPDWKTGTGNQMFIHTRKGKVWHMPSHPKLHPFRMMGRTIGSVEYLRDYTRLLEAVQNAITTDIFKVK